jgi:hypothetical protein
MKVTSILHTPTILELWLVLAANVLVIAYMGVAICKIRKREKSGWLVLMILLMIMANVFMVAANTGYCL